QAVGAEQERAVCGTAAHPRNEPANQRHVARRTDLTGEPQAGTDHHRQSHPHNAALHLHADLVGLHVSQVMWLLNHILLDGLSLLASACPPSRHGPLVEPKGRDDSLHWAAMREQRHHEAHRLGSSPQAVKYRTFRGAERLVTRGAKEALVLARVDANIALAGLASGRALQIGAEYSGGVHDASPLLALLGGMPRRSMSGPLFSLQTNLTTVKGEATGSRN